MSTSSSVVVKFFIQAYTIRASAASACLCRSVLDGKNSLSPAFLRAFASTWLSTLAPVGSPFFLDSVSEWMKLT